MTGTPPLSPAAGGVAPFAEGVAACGGCDGATGIAGGAAAVRAAVCAVEQVGAFRAVAPAGLADDALMAALAAVGLLWRLVDALQLGLVGEVAARSIRDLGDEGLSRRAGFSSPAKLVAAVTGSRVSTATGQVHLGIRLRPTVTPAGLVNDAPFPEVAAALTAGALTADAADVITRKLAEVAGTVGFTPELRDAEAALVAAATQISSGLPSSQGLGVAVGLGFSADQVGELAARMRDALNVEGSEPRDAAHQKKRFLRFFACADGMTGVSGSLPPEYAATWRAIEQAFMSPRVRFTTTPEAETDADVGDPEGSDVDAVFVDPRTAEQKRLDVFTDLISRVAALPDVPRIGGALPVVNVHADLADVEAGRGVGWIPGITEPIPASTIRRLICSGRLVTTLFGDTGQVLAHGKEKRLFTTAQNQALAARDGGCVWPGCDRPPPWCETHHVRPWQSKTFLAGTTDVTNGVLLCHFHHRDVHKSGWEIRMIGGAPHFVPPPWLDRTRTPRPATQQRTRTRARLKPFTPNTPITPGTPSTPITPSTASTPVTPSTPFTPSTPSTSSTSSTPITASTPVTPSTPFTPSTPSTSGTPRGREAPPPGAFADQVVVPRQQSAPNTRDDPWDTA